VRHVQNQKFTKLFKLLNQYLSKRDKKAVMKELNVFENELRRENSQPEIPCPTVVVDSNSLQNQFKTTLLTAMNAEPYRRVESNLEIQKILISGYEDAKTEAHNASES
jgi:Trp operon repressor